MLARQMELSYFPGRSGDLILIPKPFYITGGGGTDHLSSYTYDRMVPLILAGFGVKKGVYANTPNIVDIAPTLSFLSGVMPPALSEGRVLSEALQTQRLSP
jgi:hypothetical protein